MRLIKLMRSRKYLKLARLKRPLSKVVAAVTIARERRLSDQPCWVQLS